MPLRSLSSSSRKTVHPVFIVSHGGRRVCRSAPRTAAPSGSVTSYPTVDQVIVVHARLIAKFGGSLGLRDRGALEAALARPQIGYYQDLIQEAAGTPTRFSWICTRVAECGFKNSRTGFAVTLPETNGSAETSPRWG